MMKKENPMKYAPTKPPKDQLLLLVKMKGLLQGLKIMVQMILK